ncbi:hypothetical protein ABZ848_29310 [Streptomyces sp. NPDC047081]|uniref:hypothetical protein n=1 Tax=Streptomyces sp. NPDC047081 TaxID=3154706 RepID=UPI0033F1F2F8
MSRPPPLSRSRPYGTLSTKGRTAYGNLNGLHVALHPNGKVTSWAEDVPSPDPTPQPDDTDQPDPIGIG